MNLVRILISAILAASAVQAQQAPPTAEVVLEGLCRYVNDQPAFAITASIVVNFQGPRAFKEEVTATYDLQRPLYLRAVQKGKSFAAESVNNDQGFYTSLPGRKQYKVQATKTMADAVRSASAAPLQSDARFLAYLLQDDPMAAMKTRMTAMDHAGVEVIEGVSCHRLRLEEPDLSWDVWIEDDDTPLLRRVQPDLTAFVADQAGQFGNGKIMLQVDLDWRVVEASDKARFSFEPPADALRVREFQAVSPQSPQFELLARPMPEVKGQALDGSVVSVTGDTGQVLILDFWAIWCKPCHMLMPVLHRVAQAYADRGVRLISINVGDAAAAVGSFLKENKFDTVHAVLDTNQHVARAFGLESFPMVVLVGKDGTLQSIRAGYGPGYEEQLRQELDILVGGKPLIFRP